MLGVFYWEKGCCSLHKKKLSERETSRIETIYSKRLNFNSHFPII